MYQRYKIPSIWREMDQLQLEMNRFFENAVSQRRLGSQKYPAINLWSNENGQFVTAEMPGLKAKDIQIDVTADTLSISGKREIDTTDENTRYHRQERGFGEFSRTIQLPFMIDANSVKANFKNGILTIMLQRAEADKPKKITVKSE